jgi:hypothetical protein
MKRRGWVAPRIGGYQARDTGAPRLTATPPGRGSASIAVPTATAPSTQR